MVESSLHVTTGFSFLRYMYLYPEPIPDPESAYLYVDHYTETVLSRLSARADRVYQMISNVHRNTICIAKLRNKS